MNPDKQVHVTEWGTGENVVLVHGGTPGGGAGAFAAQKPLAQHWHLVLPDRPGHGQTPQEGREDFERDAQLLAPLLEQTSHLVGHSYGGIVAMYMAAHYPDAIKSLTLIEPPAYWMATGDPAVDDMASNNRDLFENPAADPAATMRSFFALVGIGIQIPDPAPEPFQVLAREFSQSFANIRGPDEACLNSSELVAGGYPIQILTSGRIAGFEGIAAAIARKTGATHVIVPGTDHSVQNIGEPVNRILEDFWNAAENHHRSSRTSDPGTLAEPQVDPL